ncbi:MAG: hypothetical protein P8Y29_09405 [Gemmatimonadota bacterium]
MRKLSFALVLLAFTVACQSSEPPDETSPVTETPTHVVDIVARDYVFEGPTEIPSGWTTFRMQNAGAEEHFMFLTRLPEGKTLQDYGPEVGSVFGSVMAQLEAGTIDKAEAGAMLGRDLPDWYKTSAVYMGGPGFVAPGHTAETTVNLDPGNYVAECYVKTAEGVFHVALGMALPVVVTAEDSGAGEPAADVDVTVSNDAIDGPAALAAGEHLIAVHYRDHPEAGLGNDVHLAQLSDDADVDEVVRWMDWMEIEGLRAPAPATFVGGAHEAPVDHTSYFRVDLEPGRYLGVVEAMAEIGRAKEVMVE